MDITSATPTTRARPRYTTYLDAVLESGCIQGSGTVLSLSDAGLFVATPLFLSPGTRVTTSFRIPGLGRVRLAGMVGYQSVSQEHRGLGVRFLDRKAAEDSVAAIQRWFEEFRAAGC